MTSSAKAGIESLAKKTERRVPNPKGSPENLVAPWKPGQSGNPNGRPKGSNNKLTLLREAVLANAEHIVLENWEDLVQTTVALAKAGDSTALKILWDRVIPAKRAIEEKSKEDKLNITINVNGMEVGEIFDADAKIVDAEIVEKDG